MTTIVKRNLKKQISKINSSSTPWLIPEARTHDVSGVMWVCVSGPQRLGPRADDGVVLTEVQMNAGGGVTGPRANSNEAAMWPAAGSGAKVSSWNAAGISGNLHPTAVAVDSDKSTRAASFKLSNEIRMWRVGIHPDTQSKLGCIWFLYGRR